MPLATLQRSKPPALTGARQKLSRSALTQPTHPARALHPIAQAKLRSGGTPGAGASVAPATGSPAVGAAAAGCNASQKAKGQTVELSPRLDISEVTSPCFACPNSPDNTCPKLAEKIFPPVATGPVQFSWQVEFISFDRKDGSWGPGRGDNAYVIQMIEKSFNFSTPPAAPYAYTPLYWEAFQLTDYGQTEIDYWQFDLPDLTVGTWEMKGTLYLTDQLPTGMAVGNASDAGGLPSATAEPNGLGRKLATRRIGGDFDFTRPAKKHYAT